MRPHDGLPSAPKVSRAQNDGKFDVLIPDILMCGLWMLNVPANPIIHAFRLLLLASLLGALALTLGIDLGSEGTRFG